MRPWPRATYEWGSTGPERERALPCDGLVDEPGDELYRALNVEAPAAQVFRWLCQLRAAPYSYDRIDNGGRRSPPTLTPGLENLEVGQRVMRIFRLMHFEPGRSITVLCKGRLLGTVACTYEVAPLSPQRSRLLVKVLVEYRGLRGAAMRLALPPGDLVMMRRQLLNLRQLAQQEASSPP